MLLKRFYDAKLAQASFLVGCQATGEALVLDANRDIAQYLDAAREEGLRIVKVTETHIHADYLSGSRELAQRAGAQLYLSDEGDATWKYVFAKSANAVLLKHGDVITVGNLKFEVWHTPGHTPEHLTFVLTDTPASSQPIGAFTGDFIFVGDVGRPDLLERAAHFAGTMETSARTLFRSLQKFKALPDYLQLWPGHGAGSACGKALGAMPQTTLGYEKIANWGLVESDEARFVETVLAGQPEPPRYFAEMKRVNRDGPGVDLVAIPALAGAEIARVLKEGACVVDTRPAPAFAAGHVPGTISIPLNKSFPTWAGSIAPYDAPFYVLADGAAALDKVKYDLRLVGLDNIAGSFGADALAAWTGAGGALETVAQMPTAVLAKVLGNGRAPHVLDVRNASEWAGGHLAGAQHVALGQLADRLAEVPRDQPIVVHCQGGGRSAIAASILRANGFADVTNLTGGYGQWVSEGGAVEKD